MEQISIYHGALRLAAVSFGLVWKGPAGIGTVRHGTVFNIWRGVVWLCSVWHG